MGSPRMGLCGFLREGVSVVDDDCSGLGGLVLRQNRIPISVWHLAQNECANRASPYRLHAWAKGDFAWVEDRILNPGHFSFLVVHGLPFLLWPLGSGFSQREPESIAPMRKNTTGRVNRTLCYETKVKGNLRLPSVQLPYSTVLV